MRCLTIKVCKWNRQRTLYARYSRQAGVIFPPSLIVLVLVSFYIFITICNAVGWNNTNVYNCDFVNGTEPTMHDHTTPIYLYHWPRARLWARWLRHFGLACIEQFIIMTSDHRRKSWPRPWDTNNVTQILINTKWKLDGMQMMHDG